MQMNHLLVKPYIYRIEPVETTDVCTRKISHNVSWEKEKYTKTNVREDHIDNHTSCYRYFHYYDCPFSFYIFRSNSMARFPQVTTGSEYRNVLQKFVESLFPFNKYLLSKSLITFAIRWLPDKTEDQARAVGFVISVFPLATTWPA